MVSANLAMSLDVPVLYCAQDTPASMLSRMTALHLGEEIKDIAYALTDDDHRDSIASQMDTMKQDLIFNRGAVTIDHLRDMLVALREWIGRSPPVVIIDNLIDLIVPGHNHGELTFYSVALTELKRLAQEQDTLIIALHHVTRGGGSRHGQGQSPISMNDLLYAGEREARTVFGIYNDGNDVITVQVLKQQDGRADPAGDLQIPLRWYPRAGKLVSMGGLA